MTLADVACAVGVSRALAGKVLGSGGAGNIRVSAETAQMIREAAQRLNYRPNLSARVLTGQRSRLIGVLIDALPPAVTFRTLAAIDKYATANGYRLLIGEAHDNVASLYLHYSNFIQYNVDGVICLAHDYPGQEAALRDLFHNAGNIVFIEKPVLDDVSYVEVDRAAAVEALTSLLLGTRKKIGIVMEDPAYRSVRQRQEGYCRALENAGHGKMEPLVYFMPQGNISLTLKVAQVMEEFVLPEHLDAVIAPNDLTASHLMRALQQRGIRIPAEVAVAGFDNDSFSESLYPSLTTIDDNNDLIGKYAVDLLLEQVEQGRTPGKGARTAHVTPCIIRRESI